MINIIFSISFYIAIGFIFYILLKRRAFFSLFVLGLYSLYHLFVFILVTFDESFFWGLITTLMSLFFWSWLFLLFFVPALFFDFWKAKRVAIQDSQPKSNQRQRAYLMIIIFLILISIGGVFYFFSKREENISIKNKKNEESSQFSGKNIIKDFGDTGIIVISPKLNQTISSSLKITGYIDDFGDGWEADFGSVELVDGNGGKMTSAQLEVDATDDEGNYKERPYYFESILSFNTPQTESGFLIFYEHTARGDMTEKFKLPVRFDKKMASNEALSINDWKIYKNDKYGFGFEYPPSLKIGGSDDELMASYGGQSVNFSIRIVPLQDFTTLHSSWNKMLSRTRIVNQINAKEYYNPTEEGSVNDRRFVYIPLANKKQIEIFAEIGFADASENFNKILSTFELIY